MVAASSVLTAAARWRLLMRVRGNVSRGTSSTHKSGAAPRDF